MINLSRRSVNWLRTVFCQARQTAHSRSDDVGISRACRDIVAARFILHASVNHRGAEILPSSRRSTRGIVLCHLMREILRAVGREVPRWRLALQKGSSGRDGTSLDPPRFSAAGSSVRPILVKAPAEPGTSMKDRVAESGRAHHVAGGPARLESATGTSSAKHFLISRLSNTSILARNTTR